jgi:hypothetical protein
VQVLGPAPMCVCVLGGVDVYHAGMAGWCVWEGGGLCVSSPDEGVEHQVLI